MTTFSKRYFIAVLLFLLLSTDALAKLSASLDRQTIYEGESVTLRISSRDKTAGQPDLTALKKDFVITGNRSSRQVGIVNGQQYQTTRWAIQMTPKKQGEFRIPSISIGQEKTQAFTLTVTELPENIREALSGHIHLDIEFDIDRPIYVQQQIPYTLRLYYDNAVRFGKLTGPEPDNAVVEQLGQEKQFTQYRDGQEFNVIERRYVISAEKSGDVIIPATTFSGRISIQIPEDEEPFDNEDFETLKERGFSIKPLNRLPARINRPVQISSEPFSINVLAKNKTSNGNWIPAELIQLVDSWRRSPPEMKIGEPVIRIIAIQSKGLTGTQLPTLDIKKPQGARIYSDPAEMVSKTDGRTVYGSSTQQITYIPDHAGLITIPAIDIRWWNTRTNQQQTAHLPEWEINVRGTNTTTDQSTIGKTKPADNANSGNTQHNPLSSSSLKRDTIITTAIIITLSSLFWLWKKRTARQAKTISGKPGKITYEDLHQACANNKPATDIGQILLDLAHQEWPTDPPTTLSQLADRNPNSKQAILELDQQLYGQTNNHWDSQLLWETVKDGLKPASETVADREIALEPLYPSR